MNNITKETLLDDETTLVLTSFCQSVKPPTFHAYDDKKFKILKFQNAVDMMI